MIKSILAKVALNSFKLFVIGALLVLIFLPGFTKLQDLRAKNDVLQTKIKMLREKNLALQEEQRRLQTDSTYIEGAAREKMGVVRKGEVVFHLVPSNSSAPSGTNATKQ